MGGQLKLCLMDLDERTRKSMSLVLKHRTHDSVLLSDEEAADITVVDLDLNPEQALANFHALKERKPSFRAIGLSSRADMQVDDMLVIQKPISTGRLLDAIQEITGNSLQLLKVKTGGVASSLGSRLGNETKRQASSRGPEGKTTFQPGVYLLGMILDAESEARKRGMTAIISFYGNRVIGVGGTQKIVETNLTPSQMRAFSLSAFDGNLGADPSATSGFPIPEVEYVDEAEARKRFQGETSSIPWEHFMWNLGVMTSRGRLPSHVNVDDPLYLRRWPNMTGFSHTDNEMRMIALWIKQPLCLREMIEVLGVTREEAFSVYTGAYAAGLAGKDRRQNSDDPSRTVVKEHRERGVFSSIIKRLMQRKNPVANYGVA